MYVDMYLNDVKSSVMDRWWFDGWYLDEWKDGWMVV